MHIYACIYTCMHECIMSLHIHVCVYMCMYGKSVPGYLSASVVHTFMYIRMCLCVCIVAIDGSSITCRGTLWAGCILHVVGLRILWRNARWLRLEAAVVVLHKVGGGVVFNVNYLIN